MAKFLLALFGMAITIGLGILIMIHGWGLAPQSWSWIIWGYLGTLSCTILIQIATQD